MAAGDLVIGSGGVAMVSDGLLNAVHRLGVASSELAVQHRVLDGHIAEWQLAGIHGAPIGVSTALAEMETALDIIAKAHHRTHALQVALRLGVKTYEEAEAVASGAMNFAHEVEAWQVGVFTRVFGVPILLGAVADLVAVSMLTGKSPTQLGAAAGDFVVKHPGMITSPGFADGVSDVVDNADQFEDGLLLVPPGVSELLGPHGFGLTGPVSAAAAVVALGTVFGMFRETAVSVHREQVHDQVTAPKSLTDRFDRIPSVSTGDPAQVRIIRYQEAGKPDRFDVFIGGTASFDPHATTQPFDLTSDLTGVAHESPGAYRAVVEAMRKAGVTSRTPIIVSGYSEGGLIAALVASSGHYDVKSLVTLGAPSGQIPIADSIPMLTIRHTDDLVPATGGFDTNSHAIVVERRAYAPGSDIPTDKPVPGHQRVAYEQTTRLADASTDPRLRAMLHRLDTFGDGATKTDSTLWVATRDPAHAPSSEPAPGPTPTPPSSSIFGGRAGAAPRFR